MPSDLYVSLSGQMSMDARMSTIANNVANMRTAGFRAEKINFETVISDYQRDQVNFAAVGATTMDRGAGPVEITGNPLDVAIIGDGWFGIETGAGAVYSRDGRFAINEAGDLLTLTGHAVLDDGGAPLAVNPAGGELVIGADGSIVQDGTQVGVIGLFAIPADAPLERYGDSAVRFQGEAEPIADRTTNGVRQGFIEGSNVNPVLAITELITVQRAFESAHSVERDRMENLQRAVRVLGQE